MNKITIVLCVFAFLLLIGVVIHTLIRIFLEEHEKNNKLRNRIQTLEANLAYLVKHQEAIAEIKKTENEVKIRLEEAKTDEEIADVIDSIIELNNNRL